MGLVSILLSALAVICAGVGVLTTPIPRLGLIFAFGAPALAVVGVMLGGSAMSRAKRAGETSETGRIGAILNALAFVPSLLVALTCGVCNAFFSTGQLQVHRDFRIGTSPGFGPDGGTLALPPPQRAQPGDPQAAPEPPAEPPAPVDPRGPGDRPRQAPAKPGREPQPPPAAEPGATPKPPGATPLPPPPLPPGPGR